MRFTKAATRATGVFLPGALACPPVPKAVNFTSALPFSNTPTMAKLPRMPPMGSVMIPPPSSHTRKGLTPRLSISLTSFGQPSPAHSSVQEEDRYTSMGGVTPFSSSSSAAWKKPIREHLVSEAPRPHTLPPSMSPEKGACSQSPSAGTTSWWLMSTRGFSALFPFQ